jgi:hypothetical protein
MTTHQQLYSVSKLVGYCEGLVGCGFLNEHIETTLRRHIAETLSAFNMEPHLEAVKTAMESSTCCD